MSEFERGYRAAIDDVEEAMKLSERSFFSGETVVSVNAPEIWTQKLKRLRNSRFEGSQENRVKKESNHQ